jgi:hypothetical protein
MHGTKSLKNYVVNLPSDVKDSIVYHENEMELIDIFYRHTFLFVSR